MNQLIVWRDSHHQHKYCRAFAVIAQQWSQPRFLVDPDADVFAYVQPDANPHR